MRRVLSFIFQGGKSYEDYLYYAIPPLLGRFLPLLRTSFVQCGPFSSCSHDQCLHKRGVRQHTSTLCVLCIDRKWNRNHATGADQLPTSRSGASSSNASTSTRLAPQHCLPRERVRS